VGDDKNGGKGERRGAVRRHEGEGKGTWLREAGAIEETTEQPWSGVDERSNLSVSISLEKNAADSPELRFLLELGEKPGTT